MRTTPPNPGSVQNMHEDPRTRHKLVDAPLPNTQTRPVALKSMDAHSPIQFAIGAALMTQHDAAIVLQNAFRRLAARTVMRALGEALSEKRHAATILQAAFRRRRAPQCAAQYPSFMASGQPVVLPLSLVKVAIGADKIGPSNITFRHVQMKASFQIRNATQVGIILGDLASFLKLVDHNINKVLNCICCGAAITMRDVTKCVADAISDVSRRAPPSRGTPLVRAMRNAKHTTPIVPDFVETRAAPHRQLEPAKDATTSAAAGAPAPTAPKVADNLELGPWLEGLLLTVPLT
jgi:hypothetical protein